MNSDNAENRLPLHSIQLRDEWEVLILRILRVIFLACMIFALAGSAFASGTQNSGNTGTQNGGNTGPQNGQGYQAPELDFKGPLKYELLVIAGAGILLLERRRRHRRGSLNK